ncbi:MAG: membrane dipeptidase [Anaerolineales bacterium]|nr:membrane dipeptidase [Anaerolineales bacterium]
MTAKRAGLLPGLFAAAAGLWWAGSNLERFANRVRPEPLPAVSAAAQALHQDALVIDLHCDTLLLNRDLLRRSAVGHIDLPRLQAGNVALQIFAAATRIPLGFNPTHTDERRPDVLALAYLLQRSPLAWQSPLQRALHHAAALHRFATRSAGQLRVLHHQGELADFLAQRARQPGLVGGLLGIEGTQALDGDPANVLALFAAGYRILGFSHFQDTPFAGSAHGRHKGGLSPKGRDLLARAAALPMLLDLAHLSPAGIDDVLTLTDQPLLASHGGVQATCPGPRNLSDDQIRAIAATGGVIGIGYWDTAVCGRHPRHIVAALAHVVSLVGDDHAALGSDFDGGITAAFDTSQLAVLTQQMLAAGFPEATIRKILGGNALRLLRHTLPPAP